MLPFLLLPVAALAAPAAFAPAAAAAALSFASRLLIAIRFRQAPAGVLLLLEQWDCTPEQAVVCGDFRFDLEAGRRAGTAAVYVDTDNNNLWTDWADHRVQTLHELCALVTA